MRRGSPVGVCGQGLALSLSAKLCSSCSLSTLHGVWGDKESESDQEQEEEVICDLVACSRLCRPVTLVRCTAHRVLWRVAPLLFALSPCASASPSVA